MSTRSSAFRAGSIFAISIALLVAACGWDPTRPFEREAPQVKEALQHYDAGEAGAASALLQEYLSTGVCQDGNIGTPPRLRERPQATFDEGLALFKIAEQYGRRFGDEEAQGEVDPNAKGQRGSQVDCALRIVRAIADDAQQPASLRARARYLEGNLLFLNADYKEAVSAYDKALELAPAMGDAGPLGRSDSGKVTYEADPVGRDAAWNRAIALRRIEDKKDAGQDASPNQDGGENGDGGNNNESPDGGNKDDNKDGGNNDDSKDAGNDSGKDDEKDKDAGDQNSQKPPPKDEQDAGAQPPPPSRQSQDDRILDQLENAPTVQQESAKKHGKARKVRGMADK